MASVEDSYRDYERPRKPRKSFARLREIETFAAWHREQMEGELQELCEFCGTHADAETLERDWCVEVIYYGMPIEDLLRHLEKLRRKERDAELTGDASQV